MIKYILTGAAAMAFTTAAQAATIVSEMPVYKSETIYESVEVCTKGDDKTTEGAIIGGLIGSQDGNAGIGAIIGGLIGNTIGEEKCTTERRPIGSTKEYIGKDVVVEVDGVTYTIQHRIK